MSEEDLFRRVANAVAGILNQAGYLPDDPEVGRTLEALLDAHKIMVEAMEASRASATDTGWLQ